MAQRRMFSKEITNSSDFLMMSQSAQNLYFHFGMNADDDGFCEVFTIMRMTDSKPDDLQSLHTRNFIYMIDSKVCIVKDWHENNQLRNDRYKQSKYLENSKYRELYMTIMNDKIKEISIYSGLLSSGKPNGNQMEPQDSIGKVRKGKVRIEKNKDTSDVPSQDIVLVIDSFEPVNQSFKKWYGNKTQRGAIERLLQSQSLEKILKVIKILPKTNTMSYVPTINTPLELEDKWSKLEASLLKKKGEITSKQVTVLL